MVATSTQATPTLLQKPNHHIPHQSLKTTAITLQRRQSPHFLVVFCKSMLAQVINKPDHHIFDKRQLQVLNVYTEKIFDRALWTRHAHGENSGIMCMLIALVGCLASAIAWEWESFNPCKYRTTFGSSYAFAIASKIGAANFFFANIGVYSTSKEVSKAPSVIDHGGACSSPNILPVQSLPQKTCKRILNCPSYASFVQRRYQLFHKTGRMQFDKVKPSNPGMPSGYLEFLIGGGPCIYRLNLLNLALKTVPHRIL